MSKGSTRVTLRLSEREIAEINEELSIRDRNLCVVPECFSDFVRKAIRELIRKRKAGRASRKQPTPRDQDGWPQWIIALNPEAGNV